MAHEISVDVQPRVRVETDMSSFSSIVDLPSRQVGALLANYLVEETRPYVTNFDPEWTAVTVTSDSKDGVRQAEASVRGIIEQISHGIGTEAEYLHPSCVPLLCSAWGHETIGGIEELYHVQISFTESKMPIKQFLRSIVSSPDPLLHMEHLCNVTVPIGAVQPLRNMKMWSHSTPGGSFSSFSTTESQELEKLFQYGGYQVRLSNNLCTVDFKEMQVIGTSGETAKLKRTPTSPVPDQRLKLNIRGLKLYATSALSNLKERMNKEIKSLHIVLNRTGQPFSPYSQQQVANYCRKYCVEFKFEVAGSQHILHIKGPIGYVDQLYPHVEEFVRSLDAIRLPPPAAAGIVCAPPAPSMCSGPPVVQQCRQPSTWTPQSTRCEFFSVSQLSPEWNELVSWVQQTFPAINILGLERVQNSTLWERYDLEGRQMSQRNSGRTNERFLFHGTNKMDPHEIARSESGIDFRCSSKDRKLMWGSGAYFAVNASYSDHYAYKLGDGRRQMMVVSVLTGDTCQYGSTQRPDLARPPERCPGQLYDTVRGFSGGSDIYVVYDHSKSCPAYIITYNK